MKIDQYFDNIEITSPTKTVVISFLGCVPWILAVIVSLTFLWIFSIVELLCRNQPTNTCGAVITDPEHLALINLCRDRRWSDPPPVCVQRTTAQAWELFWNWTNLKRKRLLLELCCNKNNWVILLRHTSLRLWACYKKSRRKRYLHLAYALHFLFSIGKQWNIIIRAHPHIQHTLLISLFLTCIFQI